MYEHMASLFGGPPNASHLSLYETWAKGSWGMVITGNVQVSDDHLSLGRDITVPLVLTDNTIQPFRELGTVIRGTGEQSRDKTLAIMQLSHAGRQSANILGGRWPFVSPQAPSAVRMQLDKESRPTIPSFSNLLARVMFQKPKQLSQDEIDRIIVAFARGARLALQSGFDGVELHAGHGCTSFSYVRPFRHPEIGQISSPNLSLRRYYYSQSRSVALF